MIKEARKKQRRHSLDGMGVRSLRCEGGIVQAVAAEKQVGFKSLKNPAQLYMAVQHQD